MIRGISLIIFDSYESLRHEPHQSDPVLIGLCSPTRAAFLFCRVSPCQFWLLDAARDHSHLLLLLLPWLQLKTDLIDIVLPLIRRLEASHDEVVDGLASCEVIWLELVLLNVAEDLGGEGAFEEVDERFAGGRCGTRRRD